MGIYDKRKSISRRDLKSTFGEHHGRIPQTGGRKYHHRQRSKMTEQVFGSKYGSQIDKHEYRRAVQDLQASRRNVKTVREKVAIDRQVRYLKELGGKNI